MKSAVLKCATAVVGGVMLTGCALSIRDHRGYVMDEELTQAIQVGTDNKASVEKTLGRPTFAGTFESNDWYYLGRDTRTFAFRTPKVMDQNVLHIRFDQAGNVAAINTTDEKLIAAIDPKDLDQNVAAWAAVAYAIADLPGDLGRAPEAVGRE